MQRSYKGRWDVLGVSVSAICVVHCIVLPLFITTLPIAGIELLENRWLELATILVSVLAGSIAIIRGYLKFHRNASVLWMLAIGLALMMTASLTHDHGEALLKLTGAGLIVSAHIRNYRFSRRNCPACD